MLQTRGVHGSLTQTRQLLKRGGSNVSGIASY